MRRVIQAICVAGALILCAGVALLSLSRSTKPIGLSFGSFSHWYAAAIIAGVAYVAVLAGVARRGPARRLRMAPAPPAPEVAADLTQPACDECDSRGQRRPAPVRPKPHLPDLRPSRRGNPINPMRRNLSVSVGSSHESVTDSVNLGSVKTELIY